MPAGLHNLYIEQGATFSITFRYLSGGRSLTDVRTTAGSAVVISQQANFGITDVGRDIESSRFPEGTTIISVDSGSQATLSNVAEATDTNAKMTLGFRVTDLTGYAARAKIKAYKGAATSLVELTTENGGITLGGLEGTIRLDMTAVATDALTFDTAEWDLELVISGVVTRLLQGQVALSKAVTI